MDSMAERRAEFIIGLRKAILISARLSDKMKKGIAKRNGSIRGTTLIRGTDPGLDSVFASAVSDESQNDV